MPDGRWKVGARVFTGKTRDANLRGHIPWTTGTITEVRDAHGLGLQYKVRHDIHVGEVELARCKAILAALLLLPPSVPEDLISNLRKGLTSLEAWLVANPTKSPIECTLKG